MKYFSTNKMLCATLEGVLHEVLNSVLQRVSYYCIWDLVSDARDLM